MDSDTENRGSRNGFQFYKNRASANNSPVPTFLSNSLDVLTIETDFPSEAVNFNPPTVSIEFRQKPSSMLKPWKEHREYNVSSPYGLIEAKSNSEMNLDIEDFDDYGELEDLVRPDENERLPACEVSIDGCTSNSMSPPISRSTTPRSRSPKEISKKNLPRTQTISNKIRDVREKIAANKFRGGEIDKTYKSKVMDAIPSIKANLINHSQHRNLIGHAPHVFRRMFSIHSTPITFCSWSKSGELLATLSTQDGLVCVWDLRTMELIQEILGEDGSTCCTWNGNTLLIGTKSGNPTFRVIQFILDDLTQKKNWPTEILEKQPFHILHDPSQGIKTGSVSVSFCTSAYIPEGGCLVAAVSDGLDVFILKSLGDVCKFKTIKRIPQDLHHHIPPLELDFAKDAHSLLMIGRSAVSLLTLGGHEVVNHYDVSKYGGQEIMHSSEERPTCAIWIANDMFATASCTDNSVLLWTPTAFWAENRKEGWRNLLPEVGGHIVSTAKEARSNVSKMLSRKWSSTFDVEDGPLVEPSKYARSFEAVLALPCESPIIHMSVAGSEEFLAVCQYSNKIVIFDLQCFQVCYELNPPEIGNTSFVSALACSTNTKSGLIVTGQEDGKMFVWDTCASEVVDVLSRHRREWIDTCCYSPDGSILFTASETKQNFWNTHTYMRQGEFEHDAFEVTFEILTASFSHDGKIFAIGCSNGHMCLYSTSTFELKSNFNVLDDDLYYVKMFDVDWNKNGRMAVCVAADNVHGDAVTSVSIWINMKRIKETKGIGEPTCLRFSPDNESRFLAVGTNKASAIIYKASSLKKLQVLEHKDEAIISTVCWSPDKVHSLVPVLVSADLMGRIFVWVMEPDCFGKKSFHRKQISLTESPIGRRMSRFRSDQRSPRTANLLKQKDQSLRNMLKTVGRFTTKQVLYAEEQKIQKQFFHRNRNFKGTPFTEGTRQDLGGVESPMTDDIEGSPWNMLDESKFMMELLAGLNMNTPVVKAEFTMDGQELVVAEKYRLRVFDRHSWLERNYFDLLYQPKEITCFAIQPWSRCAEMQAALCAVGYEDGTVAIIDLTSRDLNQESVLKVLDSLSSAARDVDLLHNLNHGRMATPHILNDIQHGTDVFDLQNDFIQMIRRTPRVLLARDMCTGRSIFHGLLRRGKKALNKEAIEIVTDLMKELRCFSYTKDLIGQATPLALAVHSQSAPAVKLTLDYFRAACEKNLVPVSYLLSRPSTDPINRRHPRAYLFEDLLLILERKQFAEFIGDFLKGRHVGLLPADQIVRDGFTTDLPIKKSHYVVRGSSLASPEKFWTAERTAKYEDRSLAPVAVTPLVCGIPWICDLRFLEALLKCNSLELFGIPVMKILANYKWRSFARKYFIYRVLLHIWFLVSATADVILVTIVHGRCYTWEEDGLSQPPHDHWCPNDNLREFILQWIWVIDACMLLSAVISAKEVWRRFCAHRVNRKLWEQKKTENSQGESKRCLRRFCSSINLNLLLPLMDTLGNIWSLLDFALFGLAILHVVLHQTTWKYEGSQNNDHELEIAGILGCAAWLKLLHFFTAFGPTATVVELFFAVTRDMVSFLFVLVIFILGFSLTFYAIGTYDSLIDAGVNLFAMMLSAFQLEDFESSISPNYARGVFVIFMLIVSIILLNALIAIMGNSFDRVQWKMAEEFTFRRAELIYQLELLFPNKNKDYLHVLAAKESNLVQNDGEQSDKEWEGILQLMTQNFNKEVTEMEQRIKHEMKHHVRMELKKITSILEKIHSTSASAE